MTVFHVSASNNDIHLLDYFLSLESQDTGSPSPQVNIRNKEGWTPAHLAGFLNNFDALNLLMEHGADICAKHDNKLKVYEEIVRADNADLLECIYKPWVVQDQKDRDMSIADSFGILHLASNNDTTKVLQFLLNKAKEFPNQQCNNRD
jgi:ankyrin repeat protein